MVQNHVSGLIVQNHVKFHIYLITFLNFFFNPPPPKFMHLSLQSFNYIASMPEIFSFN